jgi:pyruvate ferredoxin oxidoreductase alpha subunit
MCQIDPDVVPVYPITPQTPIIQGYAKAVADGRAHGEMVNVESEHSAMSAAVAGAVAGARTMTATSSQGLALMAEVVYIAASMRAPVVMALGNRALSGPINIHCDHSDSMLIRDSGAIQLFAESAQEAYDLTVLAPRLAEHPDVLLPVIVCVDGFTITHSAEPVLLLEDEQVREFVGDYRIPHPLLDLAEPTTQGPFAMPDYYYELRRSQAAAIEGSLPVFELLGEELSSLTGRGYGGVDTYRLDSAERALVCLGSACSASAPTGRSRPMRCARRWPTHATSWCSTVPTRPAVPRRSLSRSPTRPVPSEATSTASAGATCTQRTSEPYSAALRRSTSA